MTPALRTLQRLLHLEEATEILWKRYTMPFTMMMEEPDQNVVRMGRGDDAEWDYRQVYGREDLSLTGTVQFLLRREEPYRDLRDPRDLGKIPPSTLLVFFDPREEDGAMLDDGATITDASFASFGHDLEARLKKILMANTALDRINFDQYAMLLLLQPHWDAYVTGLAARLGGRLATPADPPMRKTLLPRSILQRLRHRFSTWGRLSMKRDQHDHKYGNIIVK